MRPWTTSDEKELLRLRIDLKWQFKYIATALGRTVDQVMSKWRRLQRPSNGPRWLFCPAEHRAMYAYLRSQVGAAAARKEIERKL